jgi:hypothetical protein
MIKDMFQIRKEIVDSKKIILLRKFRRNFYLACVSHLALIILVLITLYLPENKLGLIFNISDDFVLLIEPLSLFITATILLIVSFIKETYNNVLLADFITYLFIIFLIVSIILVNYNLIAVVIILSIISKIWSASDMGEKYNLYISFLIFIPISAYVAVYSLNPIIGYLIYLLIILAIKALPFLNEYKKIANLDQHNIETIISITEKIPPSHSNPL